ncbi:MAG TPA: hypothetical protein PLC48_00835 [Ferruginibacter sp.]|nr:hypothetical protein [Ferruginibacter sp.]
MNEHPKSKTLLIIIGILLVANIVMLAFFLLDNPEHNKADRTDKKTYISNYLKKDVGFSDKQLVQYDTISNRQRAEMKLQFEEIRKKKEQIFRQMVPMNFSDSAIELAAAAITNEQKIFERKMLQHLREIRNLCDTDQIARFDSGFYKIIGKRSEKRSKN